jgi:hypothetical protein
VAEKQHFGQMNFHGGQQIFGDKNKVSQKNTYHYGDRRDEIAPLLAEVRRSAPDATLVEPQIVVIERALEQPTPESRGQVDRALTDLARNVGNVRTAAEALTAIGAIVAAHWPF